MSKSEKSKLIFQAFLIWLVIQILCGCTQAFRPGSIEQLEENAKIAIQEKKYSRAAQYYRTISDMVPQKPIGKDAAYADIVLSFYAMLNKKLLPFSQQQQESHDIITKCDLLIAIDPHYAIEHDIYIYKMAAQFMMLRPVYDFEKCSYDALKKSIQETKLAIEQTNQGYIQQIHRYQITDAQECRNRRFMETVDDFLVYKEGVYNLTNAMQFAENAFKNGETCLSGLDLLPFKEKHSDYFDVIKLNMEIMFTKIKILSTIDIPHEHLQDLNTVMTIY